MDLPALQGTLKSFLQYHSSKASILWRSDFFIVQLSHPYMTTGKTIALTRWTFVDKVISLLIIRELQIKTTMRFTSHQLEWLSSKNPQTVNAREVVERRKPSYPVGSVQFSHSVMSDSLRPHESQHARPPCPSPSPRVHPDSRPSSL